MEVRKIVKSRIIQDGQREFEIFMMSLGWSIALMYLIFAPELSSLDPILSAVIVSLVSTGISLIATVKFTLSRVAA